MKPPSENYMSSSVRRQGRPRLCKHRQASWGKEDAAEAQGGCRQKEQGGGSGGRLGGRGCTREQGQRGGHLEIGGGPAPLSRPPLPSLCIESRQHPPALFGCLSLGPLHCVHQKNGNHPCGQVVGAADQNPEFNSLTSWPYQYQLHCGTAPHHPQGKSPAKVRAKKKAARFPLGLYLD